MGGGEILGGKKCSRGKKGEKTQEKRGFAQNEVASHGFEELKTISWDI